MPLVLWALFFIFFALTPWRFVFAEEIEFATSSEVMPQQDETPTFTTPPTAAKVQITEKGFLVGSHDGAYTFGIGGFIQLWHDAVITDAPDARSSGFALGMLRPTLHGQLSPYVRYNFTMDLAASTPQVVTASVQFLPHSNVSLIAGLQKPLFNIERWQGDVPILFLRRSDVSTLTPSRDLGLSIFTRPHTHVHMDIGVYNGAIDDSVGNAPTRGAASFHMRLLVQAFGGTDATSQHPGYLLFGGATRLRFARGDEGNPHLSIKKTLGGHAYIDFGDGVFADGSGIGVTLFGYGGYRGLYAQWEIAHLQDQIRDNTQRSSLRQTAWQLSASYAFGGDNGWYGVKPHKNLWAGGFGALAIRARIQRLTATTSNATFLTVEDEARHTASATSISGGLSWILSHPVRWQIDYNWTIYDSPQEVGAHDSEHVIRTGISVGL